jgi:hypothetical protein
LYCVGEIRIKCCGEFVEIFVIADEIAAHDRAVVCDGVSEVTDFAGFAMEFTPSTRMNGEVLQ